MNKLLLAAAIVAISPVAANAAQIVLAPVNVYASTGDYSGQFAAGNIFDQQTGAIDETVQAGYWLNPDNGNVNAALSIDLGARYALTGFDLFNTHNALYNDRGTGNFSIVGSNDATFATGVVTLVSGTLNPEQQGTPLTAQTFNATYGGGLRYLQFRPTSVATAPDGIHQSPCCGTNPELHVFGLNELRVSGGAVPEPASWALMIGGFGLVGAASRRRRLAVA